jgi:Rrf2 family protein
MGEAAVIFKADTQHALRAVTVLARERELLSTARLARRVGAPEPALAKVLQRLAQHGLVEGRPGPGGGYLLKRAAAEIPLIELVLLFEGPNFGRKCVFGLPQCADESPCPLHHGWKQILTRLMGLLETHTVAALAAGPVEALPWPDDQAGAIS